MGYACKRAYAREYMIQHYAYASVSKRDPRELSRYIDMRNISDENPGFQRHLSLLLNRLDKKDIPTHVQLVFIINIY